MIYLKEEGPDHNKSFEVSAMLDGQEMRDAEADGLKRQRNRKRLTAASYTEQKTAGVGMYLKSIEVQGFKSFANKILFEFHNGITGIVGPNGSGKSNVADAVRWVLGEQRCKQLRGGQYAGRHFCWYESFESRWALPTWRSHWIMPITSCPIDYDEVTVSRRLYRSGESEYLINGTQPAV